MTLSAAPSQFEEPRERIRIAWLELTCLPCGEVAGYTQLLSDSRQQAIERLRLAAMEKGGNAVIAMRFDCNEIGDIMSEIAAYGTAVRIEKL